MLTTTGPSDLQRFYRQAMAQQIELTTAWLTAPLRMLQVGLIWAGPVPRQAGPAEMPRPAETVTVAAAPDVAGPAKPTRRAPVTKLSERRAVAKAQPVS